MILKGIKRYPKMVKEVSATKHKYGSEVTVSFHTDTYKPTIDGHGYDVEINSFKHNLRGTILLNHETDSVYETQIKDVIKTGIFDVGTYFRATKPLEPQTEWLYNLLGKVPAYWSYANGLRDNDDFALQNSLVTRLSSVSDTSYDFDERLGHKTSSLFNYNVRDIDTSTAINNAKTALQQAINNKGWYNDFSHWHWAEFYGDKNQFEQLMTEFKILLNDTNYISLGSSEAIEYMWLRKQFKRGGLYQDGNELVLLSEVINNNALPYSVINSTLSVQVDLTGTILENKEITCNTDILKVANNQFIVQVPYSKYDGFRTIRIKETTTPKYLNFNKPSIVTKQISGSNLTIVTDRPTNVVVFTTPTGAELYQASLVSRSNIMNTNHTINIPDITGKDVYIGAITKEKQSILNKY